MTELTIIKYHIVRLDTLIDISTFSGQAIELLGEGPFEKVLPLFSQLRKTASEIIYRPKKNSPGTVLHTTIISKTYLRPADIQENLFLFTPEQLIRLEQLREQDHESQIFFSFGTGWKFNEPEFYQRLYGISPHKQKVFLSGHCPILPALIATNWFLLFTDSVTYDHIKLR